MQTACGSDEQAPSASEPSAPLLGTVWTLSAVEEYNRLFSAEDVPLGVTRYEAVNAPRLQVMAKVGGDHYFRLWRECQDCVGKMLFVESDRVEVELACTESQCNSADSGPNLEYCMEQAELLEHQGVGLVIETRPGFEFYQSRLVFTAGD